MSPKNKGTFGKGKSAVEAEDEFVSTMGRVGAALEPHTMKIVVGVSIVLLALTGIFTYRWWDQREHAKATTVYDQAVAFARAPIMPDPVPDPAAEPGAEGAADAQQGTAVPKDANNDGVPDSFPSRSARAQAALVPLQALRAEYGSTDVAVEATFLHGSMLYDAGRHADAIAMYRNYVDDGAVGQLKTMAREGMGYAQEALAMSQQDPQAKNAELDKALTIFRAIQSDEKGPERDRALYHEARLLAQLGRNQEAIDALKKALELQPDGPFSYDINQRLAQLQAGAGAAPPQ